MNYKHCCVIDVEQNFKEFVLVVEGVIQHYLLLEGESVIDTPFPGGFSHPKWDGEKWQETDPNAEIDEVIFAKKGTIADGQTKKMTGGKNNGI